MAPHCGHCVGFSITSATKSDGPVALFITLRRLAPRTNVGSRHPHRTGSRLSEQLPRAGATDNAGANYVVVFLRPSLQRPMRQRGWHMRYRRAQPRDNRAIPQTAGGVLYLHTPLADAEAPGPPLSQPSEDRKVARARARQARDPRSIIARALLPSTRPRKRIQRCRLA